MTKGFTPSVPRYQQPLTLMAREATKGKSGLNVAGYRDYRGVRTYGAWLWDNQLKIGLASEIDEADALGPFYTIRTVILTVLGITALLALGSLLFTVVIEERAGRALQKSNDELEMLVEERTAELSESQERFSLAVKAAGGGLWDIDLETGKTWYSERFKGLLGYSDDESEDSFSFDVALAASGAEGITEIENAAGEKPFELVIMDWKMPGMDGIETASRIKHHPTLSKIPAIILVTAYGREEIIQKTAA
jgi:CheY-like chemotaxis protein